MSTARKGMLSLSAHLSAPAMNIAFGNAQFLSHLAHGLATGLYQADRFLLVFFFKGSVFVCHLDHSPFVEFSSQFLSSTKAGQLQKEKQRKRIVREGKIGYEMCEIIE